MPRLTRRGLLVGTAAAAAATRLHAGDRPTNLLFLITDQHHHGVLGCMGNPIVQTPHLDRLAAGGVRFDNAFCPTPYCSPTRAALATGRYPHSVGVNENITGAEGRCTDERRLTDSTRTTFHQLADAGYACHWLGKWHLGNPHELSCFATGRDDVELPRQQVSQRRRAAGEAGLDPPRPGEERIGEVYFTPHLAAMHRLWSGEPQRSPQDLSIIGRSAWKPEYHYESVLTDHCLGLLEGHRDEPFAIGWSVGPPHAYWTAPAPFYDLYHPSQFAFPSSWSDRPAAWQNSQPARMVHLLGDEGVREYLRCYYAQVSFMDHLAGRLLDALDRLGLAERTMVVFTSDHGDMQAAHGMMGKSMPGFYDEISRVPLLLRLPGQIARGRTCTSACSSIDLAPTILDYLGLAPLADAHGASLRRAIERGGERWPVFGERGDPTRPGTGRMIHTGDWKLCLYGHGYRELYHLADDPGEVHNLADDPHHAEQRETLSRRLREHMTQLGDPAVAIIFGAGA